MVFLYPLKEASLHKVDSYSGVIILPHFGQVFLGENILKYTVSPQSSHVIEQYSIMHLPNGVIDNWPFFSFLDFR